MHSSTACLPPAGPLQSSRFTQYGVRHHEMYFPDGTCPSEQILLRFLDTAEREPGALAVSHASAGARGRLGQALQKPRLYP